ncbi:hypothetical protein BLS_008428 [Venturia inaequalis]|uniref:Uncharacterized protein n=1 Tax=Venturia inaequalis TaxID=5025 RepID=A0A8H3U6J5_VENIN|nr:hypothetical protein BLS_008428 [Venturia inaequalis]
MLDIDFGLNPGNEAKRIEMRRQREEEQAQAKANAQAQALQKEKCLQLRVARTKHRKEGLNATTGDGDASFDGPSALQIATESNTRLGREAEEARDTIAAATHTNKTLQNHLDDLNQKLSDTNQENTRLKAENQRLTTALKESEDALTSGQATLHTAKEAVRSTLRN